MRTLAANILYDDRVRRRLCRGAAPASLVRLRIENGTSVNGLAFRTSHCWRVKGLRLSPWPTPPRATGITPSFMISRRAATRRSSRRCGNTLEADVATTVTGWLFTDNVTPRTITLEDEGVRDGSVSSIDFLVVLGQIARAWCSTNRTCLKITMKSVPHCFLRPSWLAAPTSGNRRCLIISRKRTKP